VAVHPVTKKQAARRPAAKAGKLSQPAKTPPRSQSSTDNHPVKAMAIHGVPRWRHLADLVQEVLARGIMGARWLLGGTRRLGKATSPVVTFFENMIALGSHRKVKGRWLRLKPTASTEGGGEWKTVIGNGRWSTRFTCHVCLTSLVLSFLIQWIDGLGCHPDCTQLVF